MKHIGNLSVTKGATHSKKRIGRGPGSGHGGTSTRGNKGAQSRSGYKSKSGFEGGQMPMHRRLPKFGFTNRFRIDYQIVNVGDIQTAFDLGKFTSDVNPENLFELGLISKRNIPVKILGNGDISASLVFKAQKFSNSAKEKIEAAGGTIEVNE